MANHFDDAFYLAQVLSKQDSKPGKVAQGNHNQPIAKQKPKIVYLESVLAHASEKARQNFLKQVQNYREQGYEVRALGSEWDWVAEVPLLLYPFDSYPEAAFAQMESLPGSKHGCASGDFGC